MCAIWRCLIQRTFRCFSTVRLQQESWITTLRKDSLFEIVGLCKLSERNKVVLISVMFCCNNCFFNTSTFFPFYLSFRSAFWPFRKKYYDLLQRMIWKCFISIWLLRLHEKPVFKNWKTSLKVHYSVKDGSCVEQRDKSTYSFVISSISSNYVKFHIKTARPTVFLWKTNKSAWQTAI